MPAPTPSAGNPAPAPSGFTAARLLAYGRFWLVAFAALGLDQLTKYLVAERLAFGGYGPDGRVEVIRGFFYLIHVGNTGAAWSMFSGRSTALALLAVGTLAAIFYWRRALGVPHRGVQPAFGLLCGGVVGNLIDRVQLGHVVDFLDFHFGNYVYPTFNVADSAILIGVGWYLLWSLRQPPEAGNAKGPDFKSQ